MNHLLNQSDHTAKREVCRTALVVPALLVLLQLAEVKIGSAQNRPQSPVFRSDVEIARLEVTVLDREHRAVQGLTAEDFVVRIDGVRQQIISFAEVRLGASAAESITAVSSDVSTNDIVDSRVFVVIMDDASTPSDPWMIDNGKRIARRLVRGLAPHDLASVVFTWNNSFAQELTTNHESLLQAIDHFTAGPGNSPLALKYSGSTLVSAVETLAEISGRKTAIVFISAGAWADRNILRRIFSRVRVPIYAVSIAGLKSPAAVSAATVTAQPTRDPGAEALQSLAEISSGFAVVATNDALPGVDRILAENASYYVIGYQQTYSANDGRLRSVEVKIRNGRATAYPSVRRVGREVKTEQSLPPGRRAIAGILPASEVPLRVALTPVKARGLDRSGTSAVLVSLAAKSPQSPGPLVAATAEVQLHAFDPQGRTEVAGRRQTVSFPVTGKSDSSGYGADVPLSLNLNPGRYTVRVSAEFGPSGPVGSVYTDVTVPDFWHAPVSLSAAVFGTASADRTQDVTVPFPHIPSTQRSFAASDVVSVLVRLYQGGEGAIASVGLSALILDKQGTIASDLSRTVTGEQFDHVDRSHDETFPIPTTRLHRGSYVFRIEARLHDSVARRDIAFSIE